MSFADKLMLKARAIGHPLCVGLDPHLDLIPNIFRQQHNTVPSVRDVRNIVFTILDRLEGRVAVVKPQSAFYEQLGSAGVILLSEVISYARGKGLLVVLDAKRNDIGSTASAYAVAYLGNSTDLDVDALTITPYLGTDGIQPFTEKCVRHGKGAFVLAKTSNPSSKELQDLVVSNGTTIYEVVATLLRSAVDANVGPETGWSSIGLVVGATQPQDALKLREALPTSLFLIPGYGAQGASAKEAMSGFVRRNGFMEGGIISSSRSIMFPTPDLDVSAGEWENAFEASLSKAVAELSDAAQG